MTVQSKNWMKLHSVVAITNVHEGGRGRWTTTFSRIDPSVSLLSSVVVSMLVWWIFFLVITFDLVYFVLIVIRNILCSNNNTRMFGNVFTTKHSQQNSEQTFCCWSGWAIIVQVYWKLYLVYTKTILCNVLIFCNNIT